MADRQVVHQVGDIALVLVLLGQFDKERARIVEQAIPKLGLVIVNARADKIAAQRPRQEFQLEFRVLAEAFDIVNRCGDRVKQVRRAA